jgi:hypothetical protein
MSGGEYDGNEYEYIHTPYIHIHALAQVKERNTYNHHFTRMKYTFPLPFQFVMLRNHEITRLTRLWSV